MGVVSNGMTLTLTLFRTGRGCISAITHITPKNSFCTFPPLQCIVGAHVRELKDNIPRRIRRVRSAEHLRLHPAARSIKDPAKLRAIARLGYDFVEHEFRLLHELRQNPAFHPFMDLSYGSEFQTEDDIRQALLGRDIYEAQELLTRLNLQDLSPDFRESLYEQLWYESVHSTPQDLKQVLLLISTWIRIGVKPCNLFSEAFRLLPTHITKETVLLCAFYKALSHKKS